MRRIVCPLAATFAVAAIASATPVAPSTADTSGRPPAIAWAPCPDYAAAECGTLSVPVDWARPRGPRIDLALARRVRPGNVLVSCQLLIRHVRI